jgi:signal peptidase I
MQKGKRVQPFDTRIFLYNLFKRSLIIIAAGLFLKLFLLDSASINGNQMSPSILKGDRVLLFRLPHISLLSGLTKVHLMTPVVFKFPFENKKLGCLRIAGISGDTVSIDSGVFINSGKPGYTFRKRFDKQDFVPADCSPRDFFSNYRIPGPGNIYNLDSLSLRDFFFAVSVIRQENPKSKFDLKPNLLIDDSISNDYIITDFSLFKGKIDSVPPKDRYNWIFWNHFEEYLKHTLNGRKFSLKLSLSVNNTEIHSYVVKDKYLFLLADNWTDGLDSRFIGPVKRKSVYGNAVFVLWSFDNYKQNGDHFRLNRLGRIVR